MPQFQPPTGIKSRGQEKQEELNTLVQGINNVGSTIDAYRNAKLAKAQHELQMQLIQQQLASGQRENQSKYGTGVAENILPGQVTSVMPGGPEEAMLGSEIEPPTFTQESNEQKLRRMGTEGFNAESTRIKAEQERPSRLQLRVTDRNIPVLFNPLDGTTTIQATGEPYNASIHGGIRLPGDPNQSNEGMRREGLVNVGRQSIDDIRAEMDDQVLRDLKIIRNDPLGGYEQISSSKSKRVLNNLRTAIENQLYLKTGATATEDETRNAMRKFLAGVSDTREDFDGRLKILERDLGGFTKTPKAGGSSTSQDNDPLGIR